MAGDLLAFLAREYHKRGPLFRVHALNSRHIALVGPDANVFAQRNGGELLRSHETWQGFNSAMGAKDGLTAMDGPGHIRMRKAQTRGFSGSVIEGRLDEVAEITRRMTAGWGDGKPVAVHYAMQQVIAEQLAILTTGVSSGDSIDALITVLDNLLKVHVRRQRPALMLSLPRVKRARRQLEELNDRVLKHHERGDREHQDLIDDLLELHRADPQFLPETDLRLVMLGPFFAGIETAASTSAFALYAVLKRPDLLERLTDEADAFFGEGPPTAARLRGLDVTHRVVMETLRMYPAVPALPRTVANSFEFAGHRVPAGARVIVGTAVAHQLPECFPEPQRFDIDRYTPERAEHRRPGAFAPFGLGAHRCLGANFAEAQIAMTLLTLVHDWELRLSPASYELKVKHAPYPAPRAVVQAPRPAPAGGQ